MKMVNVIENVVELRDLFYDIEKHYFNMLDIGESFLECLLATHGMVVKRPMVITHDIVLVGFKEADWEGDLL